jgi:hypothetical protein
MVGVNNAPIKNPLICFLTPFDLFINTAVKFEYRSDSFTPYQTNSRKATIKWL